jgi:hypothetical protein
MAVNPTARSDVIEKATTEVEPDAWVVYPTVAKHTKKDID